MDHKKCETTIKQLIHHVENIISDNNIFKPCQKLAITLFSRKPKNNIDDANLPAVMASLEMLTVDSGPSSSSSSPSQKRTLRKRIPRKVPPEVLNRRCSLQPKKRSYSEMQNEDDIKEYYLDKNIKKQPNNLETIFEEKDGTSENAALMSAKRYKRMIQFADHPTDSKIKKRRAKIKKAFGCKINFRRRRITMQLLLDKLNDIRSDSPAKVNTDVK